MKKQLKLKEVIWEIIGDCDIHCKYCGSKDVWGKWLPTEDIIKIANNIAKSDVDEINISGGNPLLLPLEMHQELRKIFKDKKLKIIINPKGVKSGDTEKLKCYDAIGVSVNSEDELEAVKNLGSSNKSITIITNFNKSNLYLFGTIHDFIVLNRKINHAYAWQIQATMYKDDNDKAVYSSYASFKYLVDKIDNCELYQRGLVVKADNINRGGCGAGLCSCGITWDGYVLPCLSMRSWKKYPEEEYQGPSLLTEPLSKIWLEAFRDYRFGDFICCKDICKTFEMYEKLNKEEKRFDDGKYSKRPPLPCWDEAPPMVEPVYVYGVQPFSGPMAYAVFDDFRDRFRDTVLVYGVRQITTTDKTFGKTLYTPEDEPFFDPNKGTNEKS
jgi:organic radical activating enzyme